MSSDIPATDPYEAVLIDLRAKREQIEQAILVIENLRGGVASLTQRQQPKSSQDVASDGPGAFLGMTITDAAKTLLASRRKTLSNSEFAVAFKAGGLVLNSADPINTIGSVLTRRFAQVGDIVKVGRGIWGLVEWYPNRSFKKKGTAPALTKEGETANVIPEESADDHPGVSTPVLSVFE